MGLLLGLCTLHIAYIFFIILSENKDNRNQSHNLNMPPKQTKNWSETQTNECIRQFNLFKLSQGKQGWDPEKHNEPEYVKKQFKRNQMVKPYLQKSLGGLETNRDSAKAILGYQ
jgi:hypothetical protein